MQVSKCLNCDSDEAYHIADGLYLCPKCEKEEEFHLVQHVETKEIYWKNVKWAIVDENILKTN